MILEKSCSLPELEIPGSCCRKMSHCIQERAAGEGVVLATGETDARGGVDGRGDRDCDTIDGQIPVEVGEGVAP